MSQCQSSIKINSSNIIGHSLKQISTQYSWKLGNNFYLFSWKYHWFQSVASYLRVSITNDFQCQQKMGTFSLYLVIVGRNMANNLLWMNSVILADGISCSTFNLLSESPISRRKDYFGYFTSSSSSATFADSILLMIDNDKLDKQIPSTFKLVK